MADVYGVTEQGFVLKRLNNILQDISARLNQVKDETTGESLIFDLGDENDPLVDMVNAIGDQLSVCWEQLQACYNQHDPLKATGAALAGMVQLNGLAKYSNETDSSLRGRQQLSTEKTGRGMIEDIFSNILNLPGVTFCRVYQNNTLTTDARTIPAKSIAAVVVGGVDEDIAQTLFEQVPVIAQTHGSTTVQVADMYGTLYPMEFSRPASVPVYVEVSVTVVDANLWQGDAGIQKIKDSIVAYADGGAAALGITTGFIQSGFIPGLSVYASELYVPANVGLGIKINSIFVGLAASPTGDTAAIEWDEVAAIVEDNIVVTVV